MSAATVNARCMTPTCPWVGRVRTVRVDVIGPWMAWASAIAPGAGDPAGRTPRLTAAAVAFWQHPIAAPRRVPPSHISWRTNVAHQSTEDN
jgi:hypothetical protein